MVRRRQSPARSSTTSPSRPPGYGWKLNIDLSGHRLSDFPHSAHYDGSLADVDVPAQPQSVGARDRHRPSRAAFGAFYEDLLLEDQSFPE